MAKNWAAIVAISAGIAALFVLANDSSNLKVAAVYGGMAVISYVALTRKI